MSYSITKCIDPRIVRNPYTGEKISVPCGRCAGCRNRRSQSYVQRLEQERLCWKYALFFTLTYDEPSLPRVWKVGSDVFTVQDMKHIGFRKDSEVLTFTQNDLDIRNEFDLQYLYSKPSFGFLSKLVRKRLIKDCASYLERKPKEGLEYKYCKSNSLRMSKSF